jgi:hypothetical protein
MKYLSAYFHRLYMCLILMCFIAVVMKFSDAIEVQPETGFSILFRAIAVFIACLVLLILQFFPISFLFPILLGGFAWAFFPALDYWSTMKMVKSLFGIPISDAEWYMHWYSKASFVLIPVLIGHSICHSWKKRNRARRGPVEW